MIKDIITRISKNKVNIYIAIYIFGIILLSRNTMISSVILGFKTSFFISIVLLIPITLIFFKKVRKNHLDMKKTIIMGTFVFTLLLSIVMKRDWQLYNVSVIYYIISGIMLATIIKFQTFKKIYINIFFVLAIFSIVTTYVFKPILIESNVQEQMEKVGLIVNNSSEYKFLNLGLGFALFQKNYIRNYGIFTEPNFYQFYIIIAMIMILFCNTEKLRRIEYVKLAVFIATLISTFSSAAFIGLVLIAITKLIDIIIRNKDDKRKVMLILVCILILCIVLANLECVRKIIYETYKKITTINESSESRFGSLKFTVEKIIESPLIGNDIAYIMGYKNFLTNTTFSFAAIYGIIQLLYITYFSYKFVEANEIKQGWLKFIALCIVVVSYNSHAYIGVQSFWMILLVTFNLIREEKRNEKNFVDS